MKSLAPLLAAAAFGLAFAGISAAATLSTTDGASYSGAITIAKGDTVQINDPKAGAQTIPLSKIADLAMDLPTPPPDPLADQYAAREAKYLPPLLPPAAPPSQAQPSATQSATATASLDNGWSQSDIGDVTQAGSAAINGATISVTGSGWGFWGAQDSGHLVYRPISGDFDCIVHLPQLPTDTAPLNESLVVRSSLSADSPMASLTARASDAPHLTNRPLALHDKHAAVAGAKPFTWLRIVRTTAGVGGFCSADGQTWASAGWVKVSLGRDALIGVGVAAMANQELVTAVFDHFTVRTGMFGPPHGIGFVDGTRLAADLHVFDGKTVNYGYPGQPERTAPANQLSEYFTQPLPAPGDDALATGKVGIWLNTGDFIDASASGGSITAGNGQLTASSVLMGQQNVDMNQVALAVFAPPAPKDTIRVSTVTGELYYCKSISSDDGKLNLTTSLGPVTINAKDLLEVKTVTDTTFEQK